MARAESYALLVAAGAVVVAWQAVRMMAVLLRALVQLGEDVRELRADIQTAMLRADLGD